MENQIVIKLGAWLPNRSTQGEANTMLNKRKPKLYDANIQLRIPSDWLKSLKMMSFQKSLEIGDEVKYTDLIRHAIQNEFEFELKG